MAVHALRALARWIGAAVSLYRIDRATSALASGQDLYRARMLLYLLNITEAWLWIQALITIPFFAVKKPASLGLCLLGLVMIWAGRWALWRSRALEAAWIFLTTAWTGTMIFVLLSGGIHSVYLLIHVGIPVAMAVLLGRKAGLIGMAASGAVTMAMALAELLGYTFTPYFPMPPFAAWMVLALGLLLTTLPVSYTVHELSGALATAEERASRYSHDAFHDPLTCLPNRLLFLERLNHRLVLNRRYADSYYAVLFLDLDRFKAVNDSLGHAAGDMVLREVASRLSKIMRSCDTLARFGGDEFTILLEQLEDPSTAHAVAERLRASLSDDIVWGEYRVVTSASIGLVLSAPFYTHADQILRDADTAMYRAKAAGGGRIAVFHETARARAAGRQ